VHIDARLRFETAQDFVYLVAARTDDLVGAAVGWAMGCAVGTRAGTGTATGWAVLGTPGVGAALTG